MMNVHNNPRAGPLADVAGNETVDKDWWRGAVIYQIYPRSFQDTDGDGIGDIKGITKRLAHIASLGVDAIWLSPFFKSPMLDLGYDVSNYREIDPIFGTMADFDEMIDKAHTLGLKVMIDQVISHSSDQHSWFIESRADKTNRRADWYIWAEPKADGSPPNNWLSIFGGSAWQWEPRRCQYYMHNFLASQPDLNFHNSQVQDAVLDVMRFWLERGVDGFRLDTINFYFHSTGLQDNPALCPADRNSKIAPLVNPYNYQDHIHDKNQPENLEFLMRLRALLDEYPATVALGEVGDAQKGPEIAATYTSGGNKVHMCYAFELLSAEPLTPVFICQVISEFEQMAPDGWACWAFSNHDVVRHASRWADGVRDRHGFLKMTISLILSLRGSVCLYQGEELGLSEAILDLEDLQDPYGIRFWPNFKGRDGCRTPMPWTYDEAEAGFTSGKPWLPIPEEHVELAVALQEEDSNSMLRHYRDALNFRSSHVELVKGDIEFLDGSDDVLTLIRKHRSSQIYVAINMSGEAKSIAFNDKGYSALKAPGPTGKISRGVLQLPAYGTYFAKAPVSHDNFRQATKVEKNDRSEA